MRKNVLYIWHNMQTTLSRYQKRGMIFTIFYLDFLHVFYLSQICLKWTEMFDVLSGWYVCFIFGRSSEKYCFVISKSSTYSYLFHTIFTSMWLNLKQSGICNPAWQTRLKLNEALVICYLNVWSKISKCSATVPIITL